MDLAEVVKVHPNLVKDFNELVGLVAINDLIEVTNVDENYRHVAFLLLRDIANT